MTTELMYKVFEIGENERLFSLVPIQYAKFKLRYSMKTKIIPAVGKLFVFDGIENVKKFCVGNLRAPARYAICEVAANEVDFVKEFLPMWQLGDEDTIREYWHDPEEWSKKRKEFIPRQAGAFVCDSVTPLKILARFEFDSGIKSGEMEKIVKKALARKNS